MALTGKFRFRETFWGKVVLQVEEEVRPVWPSNLTRRWRDAMPLDLAAPELRSLITLRFWPRSGFQPALGAARSSATAWNGVDPASVPKIDSEPAHTAY